MKIILSSEAAVVWAIALAAAFGCSSEENAEDYGPKVGTEIEVRSPSECSTYDIFFFETGKDGMLDSYQRIENGGRLSGASRSGPRKVAVLANSGKDRYYWTGVTSFGDLSGFLACLADEDPERPILSGTTSVEAGRDRKCDIMLMPVTAEVVLRSIRADFSGRPYEGESLEDVKAYLINIRSEYPVFGDNGGAVAIANYGRLDSTYLKTMRCPGIVCRSIPGKVGKQAVRTDIRLYCYPDNGKEDGLGSPLTRLVIEGRIRGETYYYPLDINRVSRPGYLADGLNRGSSYVFDVVITRRGSKNPDSPVSKESLTASISIGEWGGTKNGTIHYRSESWTEGY